MPRFLPLLILLIATPSLADAPRVVTDLRPVHAITAAVMDGIGVPDLLVDGAQDAHHVQLRPSQARMLAQADIVIWVGEDMTPWLGRTLDALQIRSNATSLLDAPGMIRRPPIFAEPDNHDLDDDHDDGHGHDHADGDPHAWLDPVNAAVWATAIAEALAQADPDNAARYRGNARATTMSLEALTDEIADTLAPVQDLPLAVFHDAYAHFAGRFGLSFMASLTDGDATTPGAASAADLRTRLETGQIACLLTEAQMSGALALRLAEGTRAKIVELDPLGVRPEPGSDLYPRLMRGMAQAIASCGQPG